jgi:(+)-abscisic acid 8'-hydroxylase
MDLLDLPQFSFDVGILSIFGRLDDKYREKLKENYCIVDKGYNSFPTNILGTPYSKALLVSYIQILFVNS